MRKLIAHILAILLALLLAHTAAEAQQGKKVPRIGFVGSGNPSAPGPEVEVFRQGLRDLGYIEGKNIAVEYRYAEGRLDRLPSLVTELVELKVDVLIVGPQPAIRAAKQATKTIPIVMLSSVDPVSAGYVDSLARPGGNITGVNLLNRDLSAKRVELLLEVLPKMSRLAVLWDPAGPGPTVAFKEYEGAARAFKLDLQSLEVRGPKPDLEGLFEAAKKERRDALIIVINPLIGFHQKRIIELAAKNRLPSMYETSRFVESGGLLSYAANSSDLYRRAATYVDKILKGTKPADLPVEQPMKFEMVINLKTAKQIGLTIPQSVLYRADKVIK